MNTEFSRHKSRVKYSNYHLHWPTFYEMMVDSVVFYEVLFELFTAE